MNPAALARLQRWVATAVLVGGLAVAVLQAVARFMVLGRPFLPPGSVPAGGGVGSVSAGGISLDVVVFVPAALAVAVCLARAPRGRRWWAPVYLAAAGIYVVARVAHVVSHAAVFMRAIQEQGGEYLTRPRPYGVADIAWIVVDAAFFASLFVAIWLWLRAAPTETPRLEVP